MGKIEVRYAIKGELDFGLFPDKFAEGKIKVDKDLWKKYVAKRLEFDQMQDILWLKIMYGKREKLNKKLLKLRQGEQNE